jgi:hypothetical protein
MVIVKWQRAALTAWSIQYASSEGLSEYCLKTISYVTACQMTLNASVDSLRIE